VPALLDGLRQCDPDLRARCATLLNHVAPDDETVAAALRAAGEEDDRCRAMSGTDHHAVPLALVGA
jgi:hypothetical protein